MSAHSNDVVGEHYSPGYGDELVGSYQERSVGREAAFFRPFLQPGMKLLDCGCGPGSITLGLAQIVSPGEVWGIDIEPSQVALASSRQREAGVSNLQFQVASVYALPFPDDTFDAVFMHAILQHLRDPLAAIQEARRVLKRGGVVGVRDDDLGSLISSPTNPDMDRVIELLGKIMQRSGGNPYVGRTHRNLLRKGGFMRVRGFASSECDGTLETTRTRGDLGATLLEHMAEEIVTLDWATAAEMKQMIAASRAWGRDADAYDVITWCEAVGWKED
jgi:SAM-dependent methyltransferase